MAGQKITLYALDCGTVNWRLYRMEYHYEGDNARHVTSPLSSPLAHFSGRRLPAVLLLTPDGIAKQAIGETALGYLEDPKARKRIREFFKPSIGSHVIDDPKPHQLRYSHFDALFFTRLLLRSLIDQIRIEKYNAESFDDQVHFSIAYPDRWLKEHDGKVFEDFYHVTLECFPPELSDRVHFVPESEGVILGLRDQDLLDSFHPQDVNLIIDVGGSTTTLYARKFNPKTGVLDYVSRYEEPFGGGLYDALLAQHLTKLLEIPAKSLAEDASAFMVLRLHSQMIKEALAQQALRGEEVLDPLSGLNSLTLVTNSGQVYRENIDLSLEDFNRLSQPLDQTFQQVISRALDHMEVDEEIIGRVVLLGGGVLIPGILDGINRRFGKQKVIFPENPQEMIVRGIGLAFTNSRPERENEEKQYIPEKKTGWRLIQSDGSVLDISKEIMIAGRSSQSDIILESGKCSRTHALIRLEGNALVLMDLRSKNGTFINHQRLDPNAAVRLRAGDEIRFGDQNFSLE
jgi:hypothetical protein